MAQSELDTETPPMKAPVRKTSEQLPELLSSSRQQKFDLLTSLIRTQRQPLIICGPEGIGKTTMLTLLAKTNNQQYLWNYIECDGTLTLDTLINHLSTVLGVKPGSALSKHQENKAEPLITQLARIADNGQTVVIILDDAGKLSAGVFSELFDFVRTCKSLRIVVSITPDHLFVKRATDPNIDECYLVEIPLLSESQAESFAFMHLKENRELLAFESISQDIASEIYRKTHGIPGLMLQELAGMQSKSSKIFDHSKYSLLKLLGALLTVGLLVWLGFRLIGTDGEQQGKVKYVELSPKPSTIQPAPPQAIEADSVPSTDNSPSMPTQISDLELAEQTRNAVQPPPAQLNENSVIASTQEIINTTLDQGISTLSHTQSEQGEPSISENQVPTEAPPSSAMPEQIDNNQANKPPITVQPAPATTNKPALQAQQPQIALSSIRSPDWVLSQNQQAFTLQLSAFPNTAGVQRFLNKFPKIQPHIAYYTMKRQGKTWYGIIYGIYPTAQHARLASESLPAAIGKPYMQSLNKIHGRIKDSR